MPETHVVSYSELDTYRQCPLKWQVAYRDRWSKPPKEGSALFRGSLFHSVLETWYKGIQGGTPQALEDCRRTIGILLDVDMPEQTEEQELVAWIFNGYVELYQTDSDWEIAAVEYANEFWLPTERGGRSNFKLKVKIDLVVRHRSTGKLWIVDHKTCRHLPKRQMLEFDDQFGLYTWGLRKMGKPVIGSIHNACRTERLKTREMASDERFLRTLLYRTDEELDIIAVEAYRTAKRAWSQTPDGQAERNTNTDTCFIGETQVRPVGKLQRVSRRWYSGDLITITTASGNKLSGTPNHPVFTNQGWVPLGSLCQGDSVVNSSLVDNDGVASVKPNEQHCPPTLAQIFEAGEAVKRRVSGMTMNLHGEIPDGDVDIVTMDSRLTLKIDALFGEQVCEIVLPLPNSRPPIDPLFSSQSRTNELLVSSGVTASLAHSTERLALLDRPPTSQEPIGILTGSRGQPDCSQILDNCPSGHVEVVGQGQDRLPAIESVDKIVDFSVSQFEGHVYTLQTSSGTYAAGQYSTSGALVANCGWRCDFNSACLSGRKGGDMLQILNASGFTKNTERH